MLARGVGLRNIEVDSPFERVERVPVGPPEFVALESVLVAVERKQAFERVVGVVEHELPVGGGYYFGASLFEQGDFVFRRLPLRADPPDVELADPTAGRSATCCNRFSFLAPPRARRRRGRSSAFDILARGERARRRCRT